MGTIKVNSVAQFMLLAQKEIDTATLIAIQEVAEQASEKLRELTGQWYSNHMPTMYERTYEFINSITIDKPVFQNEGWFIGVYFDPNKMNLGENNGWSQHEDRFNLSEIIEEGWQAGSRYIEGSEAMFGTAEWAEIGNFARIIKEEFTKLGFRVK
jgi:hypothetical protein